MAYLLSVRSKQIQLISGHVYSLMLRELQVNLKWDLGEKGGEGSEEWGHSVGEHEVHL